MYYHGKIPDHRRRLAHAAGSGFILGGACGSVCHFIRGFHGSPGGARLAAGARDALRNAPRHACSMAAGSVLMCSVEAAVCLGRRREDPWKEDPWNPIAAGAATLSLLSVHRGARAALLSAPVGAAVIAAASGVFWYISEVHGRLMSLVDTQTERNIYAYLNLPRPVAPRVSEGLPIEQVKENKEKGAIVEFATLPPRLL